MRKLELITCEKHKIKDADCDDCLDEIITHTEAKMETKE